MQKLFTLTFILFIASSAMAQFKKGDKVLGAGLNFQTSKSENNSYTIPSTNTQTGFSLSAELGFAKKENRLSGFFASAGYGKTKNEYPSLPTANSKSDNFNVAAGYFSRAYKSLGKNFYVFGEGRAGFNYSQADNSKSISGPEIRDYGVNLGLYPGLSYKWNDRFLLELRFADFVSVGYSKREAKSVNDTKDIQRNFSLGSSLGLGYLSNIGIGARWVIK